MKKKVLSLMLSAAVTVSLSAATAVPAMAEILDNGRYDKLVVAIAEDPQDLEGDDINVGSRYYWIYDVYQALFDFADDGSGELKPCIAKEYEVSENGTVWTVKLNEDVFDSDGNNITSSDVKFCFDWIIDHGQAIRFDYFDYIEIIDDYTFEFHWKEEPPAIAEIEFPLVRTLIYSEKAYNDHGGMTTEACGTGCYTVKEFVSGSKVVLEANDEYWGLDHEELQGRHKANVQTLELDVVSESSTAVIGLETGTLDVCHYVPLSMSEEFISGEYADKYNVETIVQGDYWYAAPNGQTVNADLRKAIFYAIDNNAIAAAMGGQYVPATTLGNSAYKDYDESLEATGTYIDTMDQDKAKECLEASGYNGEELTLICVNNEAATKAAQMIQIQCAEVGINFAINAVTNDTYNTITSPAHSDEWDMMINTLGGPSMVGSWHLLMDNEVNNGVTFSLIEDEKLQEVYEAANADATHDAEHMREVIDYVIDNAYVDVLVNASTSLVYTKDIESMYYREGYYTPSASTFVGQE